MTAPVNHWKLGFFVLITVGAVIVAVIAVGESSTHHPTVGFVTYFDESVGGLGSGQRVEFRGVQVGTVSSISIAPDHRRVAVAYDLDVDALPKMGVTVAEQDHAKRYHVPPDLRAQIGGNGLTGVRNVSIDLFDPQENPPPVLPFAVPSGYIPAATSTMKGLEDALTKAATEVPKLAGSAAATLERAGAALVTLDDSMRRFDRERVPEKTSKALSDASAALVKMDHVLDRLDGLSSSTHDLDEALDELRDTAEAIRVLAEDLDRDPDMLLKGRPRGARR